MVNKEVLRSPQDANPTEPFVDHGISDPLYKNQDTFTDRTHAFDNTSPAFNATRSMTVPDRIVLAGSESHYELPGRPRELELDDQVYNNWSPSRIPISIQTPPRRLTLHDHSYPTADTDEFDEDVASSSQRSSRRQQQQEMNNSVIAAAHAAGFTEDADDEEQQFSYPQGEALVTTPKGLRERRPQFRTSAQQTSLQQQQQKPLSTKGTNEKRVVDLYRRLEALEKDNRQRRIREIVVYVGFVGYFVYRSFSYMFARSRPY